jgi:SNF2 family DNA or RNA helicase
MKNGGMTYISQLRPASYQLVPLLKILNNGLNCVLICDGVGVGKTISAGYIISFMTSLLKQSAIVVCPPSLIMKWKEELEEKFSLRTMVVSSKEEFFTMEHEIRVKNKKSTVYILPFSIINKSKLKEDTKLSVIVYDEIHNFRNAETIGYNAAKNLSKHAEYRVGLSATPINNSIDDFISELSILFPNHSWHAISTTLDDLWHRHKDVITNSLVTRFTKENLGIHFAKRLIANYEVNFPSDYVERVKDLISLIPTSRKNSFFEKVTYYRLAASSSKAFQNSMKLKDDLIEIDPKITMLKKILSVKESSKWIIFCEFSDTVESLAKELSKKWDIYLLTGDTPLFKRHSVINEFRNSTKSILLMTPVGSEGLDIQFCNAVINYDLHWNPMKIEQRIGRVDRIGQKKKQIVVVNIIVKGSIDYKIIEVIKNKLAIISDSVFNVPPTISASSKTNNLFDEETFNTEYGNGKGLLRSIKYWESLPSNDYLILKKIDLDSCHVDVLINEAKDIKTSWLLNSTKLKKWLIELKKNSQSIKERIDLYS